MGLFSTMFALAIVGALVVRVGRWFEQRRDRERNAQDINHALSNEAEHLIWRG